MNRRPTSAFTLIELLVVIAIIGIVASLTLSLASHAGRLRKERVVETTKHRLMTMIDLYHSRMGYYPPDNGSNVLVAPGSAYEVYTAINPLLYELTGCLLTNTSPTTISFISTNLDGAMFDGPAYSKIYDRGGVVNSDPSEMRSFFKPGPKTNEYVAYAGQGGAATIFMGLIVPVDGPDLFNPNQLWFKTPLGGPPSTTTNYWHYDCTSTNRHNPGSYDLWAEFVVGKDTSNNWLVITNGNW